MYQQQEELQKAKRTVRRWALGLAWWNVVLTIVAVVTLFGIFSMKLLLANKELLVNFSSDQIQSFQYLSSGPVATFQSIVAIYALALTILYFITAVKTKRDIVPSPTVFYLGSAYYVLSIVGNTVLVGFEWSSAVMSGVFAALYVYAAQKARDWADLKRAYEEEMIQEDGFERE